MKRRAILTVTGASVASSLGGCLDRSDGTGPENGAESPETRTDEVDGNTPGYSDDEVQIGVSNEGTTATVGIEVKRAAEVVVAHETSIEGGGGRRFDSGITETGEYEVSVSVDGTEEASIYEVGESELERGSNVLVFVEEDREIKFGIED